MVLYRSQNVGYNNSNLSLVEIVYHVKKIVQLHLLGLRRTYYNLILPQIRTTTTSTRLEMLWAKLATVALNAVVAGVTTVIVSKRLLFLSRKTVVRSFRWMGCLHFVLEFINMYFNFSPGKTIEIIQKKMYQF